MEEFLARLELERFIELCINGKLTSIEWEAFEFIKELEMLGIVAFLNSGLIE